MQVLLNLLSNAAKFVPSPGGRIVLRLRVDAHGRHRGGARQRPRRARGRSAR